MPARVGAGAAAVNVFSKGLALFAGGLSTKPSGSMVASLSQADFASVPSPAVEVSAELVNDMEAGAGGFTTEGAYILLAVGCV